MTGLSVSGLHIRVLKKTDRLKWKEQHISKRLFGRTMDNRLIWTQSGL